MHLHEVGHCWHLLKGKERKELTLIRIRYN